MRYNLTYCLMNIKYKYNNNNIRFPIPGVLALRIRPLVLYTKMLVIYILGGFRTVATPQTES